jgi:hypothetical protein
MSVLPFTTFHLLQQQQPQAGSPHYSFCATLGAQFCHNGIDVEFDGMVTDV